MKTPTEQIRDALEIAKDKLRYEGFESQSFVMEEALSLLNDCVVIQGWQPIETAPKDGTVIEIGCLYDYKGFGDYGYTISLAKYEEGPNYDYSGCPECECKHCVSQDKTYISLKTFAVSCSADDATHWRPAIKPPKQTENEQ